MAVWWTLFFVIGMLGTWLARAYALQRNLIDEPGERRSHAIATPRGGGVAIVLALLVAAIALALRDPSQAAALTAFAAGLLLVAGIGWWDDHRPLGAWCRLLVHAVAASMLAVMAWSLHGDAWLAIVAFVASIALTNVWNFMDGIDGLAASQAALVVAAFAATLSGSVWGWLGWAMVAACIGFLPLNFPRARIFLGDVGSGALGFAIAALAVAAMGRQRDAWPLALLPVSAFLIDAGLTLGRRIMRREQWWAAHTQHAYQGWARRAGSHVEVTLAYAVWTIAAVLLAAALRVSAVFFMLTVILAWYMSGAFLWWCLQSRGNSNARGGEMEWREQ